MGALFALFSAMLSVQPIWLSPFADSALLCGGIAVVVGDEGSVCRVGMAKIEDRWCGGYSYAVVDQYRGISVQPDHGIHW